MQFGQTVFAAYMDEGEPTIEEWMVRGMSFHDGKWYAIGNDLEEFEVGRWGCLLTRGEAERLLENHLLSHNALDGVARSPVTSNGADH